MATRAADQVPIARASVIIPAHNEERTIERTLGTLLRDASADEFDVLVMCNGCTDRTADRARKFGRGVRVIEVEQASKAAAVRVGNQTAEGFPRVHLDADVELDTDGVRALIAPLAAGECDATAPHRTIVRDRMGMLVRSYYDVWESLPQVQDGLFGRGVIALSARGQRRVSALPEMMSDDLAISEAFEPAERRIVESATVLVRPPRTLRDLIRRRVRVATGNAQADRLGRRASASQTSPRTLIRIIARRPGLALRMPVFVVVTVVARILAGRAIRKGDFTTWQRDESSRE